MYNIETFTKDATSLKNMCFFCCQVYNNRATTISLYDTIPIYNYTGKCTLKDTLTSTKQIVGVWYGGALDTFCFPNIGGGGGAVRGGYFKLVFLECSVYV